MGNGNNDIKTYTAEDIARYWNGKMSAQEMHALEAAAMDDPFLADAMEGYSAMQPAVISTDVQELRKRLTAREKDDKKVIPFRWWRIAAILIFLGGASMLTYLLMRQNTSFNNAEQAYKPADSAPVLKPDTLTTSSFAVIDSTTATKEKARTQRSVLPPPHETSHYNSRVPVAAAEKAIVPDLSSYKREDTVFKDAAKKAADKADSVSLAANDERKMNGLLQGRASGITITPAARDNARFAPVTFNNFSGRVVDQRNNAIPFASVRVNNNNQAATTNADGFFNIKSPDSVLNLSFNSIGFESRQLTLRGNEPQNITLDQMDDKKLSEVVVTNAGLTKRKNAKSSDLKVYTMDAQPVIGWDEYNKYLDSNKRTPSENVTGEVTVSFWVNKRGRLSDFTIEKSLGKEQDAEAIRLIKEGPEWKILKGRKTRARVIVNF